MPTIAAHVWRPSSARVVVLDSFVAVPRGSTLAAAPLVWPAKDPADVLDYQFDVSAALVGNDGDAIQSLDITIEPGDPGDLSLNAVAADGTSAVLWLAAGQAGTTYAVTLQIVTSNGRTIQRSVMLPVLALSSLPGGTSALQTDSGMTLTDQNGNPVLIA